MREIKPDCQLSARLVYWGAKGAGKSRSLIEIHARTPEMLRGKLVSVDAHGCGTLFFDQRLGEPTPGMVGVTLSAVYEGDANRETQLKMLREADGVEMVVGSRPEDVQAAGESLTELRDRLREMGRDENGLPLVFQFNKRDISPAVPVEEINQALNPEGLPWVTSVATDGEGVREALELAIAAIVKKRGTSRSRRAGSAPISPRDSNQRRADRNRDPRVVIFTR